MTDHNRLVEQAGVYYVGFLAARFGYLFRQIREHDKGIDAEMEVTQSLGVASPIIAVQVKARSEFKNVGNNEISITVTEQNLAFWKSYGRPVILMAYLDGQTDVFWSRVDNATSKTIRVSLDRKFDQNTINDFERIISQYYVNITLSTPIRNVSEILSDFGTDIGKVIKAIEDKVRKADELMEARNFAEAVRIYQALATVHEEVSSLWHNWSACLLELGDYKEAYDIAEYALNKSGGTGDSYALVGACLAHLGKSQEAENYLLEAIKCSPLSSLAWNSLGQFHYWQGKDKEAHEELSVAVSYDPNDEYIRFNLALCSTALEKYEEALDHYDKCIQINPKFYDAYNNKGLLLRRLWRIWEALECYDAAIRIDNHHPYALCNSAFLLKDLGYDERAIQRYQMALESRPSEGKILENLGSLFCRVGELTKAAACFDEIRDYIRIDMTNRSSAITEIIDIGYEVSYRIRLLFTRKSVQVLFVEDISRLAIFKSLPFMREYLTRAHEINRPVYPDDPREDVSLEKRNPLNRSKI